MKRNRHIYFVRSSFLFLKSGLNGENGFNF